MQLQHLGRGQNQDRPRPQMLGSPNFDPPFLRCPDHQGTHDVIPGRGSRAGDDETSQNAPWIKKNKRM